MNYQKIHDLLILRSFARKLNESVYVERHHVVPKCLGGTNEKQNIAILTGREHFLIHWLLHRIHPNNSKLALAFVRCSRINRIDRQFIPSSRAYEEARIAQSKTMSEFHKGRKNSDEAIKKTADKNRGKKRSLEAKKKMSDKRKGVEPWNKGVKYSKETCDKISKSLIGRTPWNKGVPMSEEAKINISEKLKGRVSPNKGKVGMFSQETIEKIANASRGNKNMLGKKHTQETKIKIGEKNKGNVPGNIQPIAQINPIDFKIIKIFESGKAARIALDAKACIWASKTNFKHKCAKFYWKQVRHLTEEEIQSGYANRP